jgi:hypothetical protein
VNAWDEPKEQVAEFARSQLLPYTILLKGAEVYKKSYGGGSIPRTFLLDREGRVSSSHTGWGAGDEKRLASEIEKLLQS